MSAGGRTRLAVLGSPIAHSKSPLLHATAYDVLGLPWSYSAVDVTERTLPGFLERTVDDGWRGLSLTMPLKRAVLPFLRERDALVDTVGGANTVLVTGDGLVGYNTDVDGVSRALDAAGITAARHVHLLGAGATAAAVVASVVGRGASTVTVSARSAERARPIARLVARLGATAEIIPLSASPSEPAGLVVSTLPGGSGADVLAAGVPVGAPLFDVAYDPWPSELAARWSSAGQQVVSGLDMLVFQALGQIRVFVGGDPRRPVPSEASVLAAMRASVGLPAQGRPAL
ncbi:MAG: hypothetical protein RI885_1965 [Actinomycetota bacterium]